jgi:hypothetical protein
MPSSCAAPVIEMQVIEEKIERKRRSIEGRREMCCNVRLPL